MVVRALSASRIAVPRGVRGRARAREHTWALRTSHEGAHDRSDGLGNGDVKKYAGGVWKSALSARQIARPRGVS